MYNNRSGNLLVTKEIGIPLDHSQSNRDGTLTENPKMENDSITDKIYRFART